MSQEEGLKDRSMVVAFVVVKTHINGRVTSITEVERALPVGAVVAASQNIAAKANQATAEANPVTEKVNQATAIANQAAAARVNQAVVRAIHQERENLNGALTVNPRVAQ